VQNNFLLIFYVQCNKVRQTFTVAKDTDNQNQIKINIRLIRWQNTTTVTDAKLVYINTMLLDGRRTKLTSG